MATSLIPDPLTEDSPKHGLNTAEWLRRLPRERAAMEQMPPGTVTKCLDYHVRINNGPNYYMLFKDIFVQRIYHFHAARPDPFIVDCGSNIGMSILYFKHVYPAARIIGFEPDPTIYPLLEENVGRNELRDVQLRKAAVADREGMVAFASDGICASCLNDYLSPAESDRRARFEVPCVRLRDVLKQPVDFLKMNVEGAEWEVIADSESSLHNVRELVIEYHHLPGLPRTLHKILEVLDRQGFDYLINDFDEQTNPGSRPPFRLHPRSAYFLLIYAKKVE